MPAIQDTYSIDVRNRYDLGGDDSGNDSEEVENVDPLEQLKKLEEEKEREREQKRQLKLQQAAAKKREQRRKEKEAAARKESAQRKEPEAPRPEKPAGRPETGNNRGPRRERPAQGDRPAPGNDRGNDERLPPRRRNEFNRRDQQRPRVEGGEGGDRFGERKYDRPAQPYNDRRPPQGGMDGEGRPERFDRPDRPERFRGSRGGYRGGGGGYRGGRGGGRNDGRDDRGKREFERRSGSDRTSVRPTEKREGGGPRNWGSPTEDTESTEVALPAHEDIGNWADHVDNETQQPAEPRSEPPAEGEGEEKGVDEGIAEPEPEEVELTLDEWRAQQEVQRKQEFNIRQPGEGEDMAKWRNCELLHQSTLIAQKNDEQNAQHGHSESHRRQMMKQHLDVIDVRFTNEQKMGGRGGSRGGGRGGGPRGGRGGGRGRGGPRSDERGFRGAPRGGRYEDRANQPPDVLNEKEFPTLPAA